MNANGGPDSYRGRVRPPRPPRRPPAALGIPADGIYTTITGPLRTSWRWPHLYRITAAVHGVRQGEDRHTLTLRGASRTADAMEADLRGTHA